MKYACKIPSFRQLTISERNEKTKSYSRILESIGCVNYSTFDTKSEAEDHRLLIQNLTGLEMTVVPTRGYL